MMDPPTESKGREEERGSPPEVSLGPSQWVPKGALSKFLLEGAAGAFFAQLLAIVAAIASQVFLARLLSPEELGIYFLTQSIVLTAGVVGEFGLNRPIARMISIDVGAGQEGAAMRALLTAIGISSISGCLVVGVYIGGFGDWLALHVFDSSLMATTVMLVGLWITGRLVLSIGAAVLQGLYRVGLSALLSGTVSGVLLTVICGLLLWTQTPVDYDMIIVIATATTVVSAVVCVALVWSSFAGVRPAGPSRSRALLVSTIPIYTAGILQMAAVQGDLWIVGAQLNPADVALYGAAKRLTVMVGFPLMALSVVVPPLISDLFARGEVDRLQRLLRASATGASLPAAGAFAVFMIFGREILTLAYGEVYAEAAMVLYILCAERVVFILLGSSSLLLLMTGHENVVFRITMVSATLSLLTTYLGGLLGGLTGIAVGFSVSSSATALWYFFEAHRYTGIWAHVSPFALKSMAEVFQQMTRKGS